MIRKYSFFLIFVFLCIVVDSSAAVGSTFMGSSLLQMPTTQDIGKQNLDFWFSHRFGDASKGLDNFFGLDNGANVLLALDYGITDRWSLGFSRISEGKTYEVRNKFRIVSQSKSFPFTVSLWGVAGQRTVKEVYSFGPYIFPNLTNDSGTRFSPPGLLAGFPQPVVNLVNQTLQTRLNEYTLTDQDKRSYMVSLLIASRISDRLSVQLSPVYVHRNFVKYGLGNDRTGLDVGGRVKVTKRLDITFEAMFTPHRDYIGQDYRTLDVLDYGGARNLAPQEINSRYNQPKDLPFVYATNVLFDKPVPHYFVPFSIGFDIETGGHVFQIVFSNSRALAQTALLNGADFNYANKEFVIGFNIHRYFSFAPEPKFDEWKD